MGHKAAETIRSINNAFGPGTDNIQCSGCPRSFTEEKRALQMSRLASHQKLTTTSWVIIKNDPPTMTLEIAKNPTSTILPLFGIWSKLERWKSSISGCLVSWPKILKITILKCHLLLFYATIPHHFLPGLWHATTGGLRKTGTNQLTGWIEKQLQSTSESQTCIKKTSWFTVGWSAACLMCLSESQQNHHIWEACSANQWDELKIAMPAVCNGQQNGPNSSPRQIPISRCTTNSSKVEWTGPPSFASSTIFPWLLAKRQLFAGKMLPQPAGGRKSFQSVHWIPKHGFLCYRNKKTYFSLAKMCWL